MDYSILNSIKCSNDVSSLSKDKLPQLCDETRQFLIQSVSKTGGHLSANLGVIEIETALHYCFSTPIDKFVFDVGHQCYTHKLYTGRKDQFDTLRQLNGLSGFPSPYESEDDAFIAGHGSTSISVAVGMAKAKKIKNEKGYVIALIGDGAFTGGMAYEGLNNCDISLDNLIIILNDNKMSISKNVGAVADYLARLRTNETYLDVKAGVSDTLKKIPILGKCISDLIVNSKKFVRQNIINSGAFFESLGLTYYQIADGNNVYDCVSALEAAKRIEGPVLIHAITTKGKGFEPAEQNPGEFHGVSAFSIDKVPDPDEAPKDSFSTVFGKNLVNLAHKNDNICAITAAMKYGTGLQFFYREYKNRFFDVGMAEEHAVTFSAALAKSGLEPVVCLYSTFMQRSMDQYIHDVMLQNLNVLFGIDRAGLVPGDGETHQGIHDIAIFSSYNNTPIVCPANYNELIYWQEYLIDNFKGAKVLRYSRGGQDSSLSDYKCTGNKYDLIGDKTNNILIVCYGRHFNECLKAQNELKQQNISVDILKLNWINPIPENVIDLMKKYSNIHFYEEHVKNGGVAQKFATQLLENGYKNSFKSHCIPNYIVKAATVSQLFKLCKLDKDSIINDIKEIYEN